MGLQGWGVGRKNYGSRGRKVKADFRYDMGPIKGKLKRQFRDVG